ncbi:hypothetical protein D3C81_1155140 [compost metagenome]
MAHYLLSRDFGGGDSPGVEASGQGHFAAGAGVGEGGQGRRKRENELPGTVRAFFHRVHEIVSFFRFHGSGDYRSENPYV